MLEAVDAGMFIAVEDDAPMPVIMAEDAVEDIVMSMVASGLSFVRARKCDPSKLLTAWFEQW